MVADYPDSDPEETFDREEPDYDQCGFLNDEDDKNGDSPIGAHRDNYLADMLRSSMKLRKSGDDDEEDDVDEEEANRWDSGGE